MIAKDYMRFPVLEKLHDFIREAVFVYTVAETNQLVDLAHQLQRLPQARGIAVNIGDDAEFHLATPVAALPQRRMARGVLRFFRIICGVLSPKG
jgi:hypothetical protein